MGEVLRRQRRTCRAAVWAVMLLVASATSAFAQFDRGTISGTIKDAQGGVVPGVTVTATSTQTQQTRSTVTDGSGFYTFPNLQPGRYDISAELQGFKKETRTGVQVDAASALNLEFTLATGVVDRRSHGHLRSHAAADRRRRPQDGRGQGHRAAVVHRPQPDWRARAQGRRHRRQLQQRRRPCRSPPAASTSTAAASDENVIYVDGAVATRTRSAGSMIGVQNADTVQEVQVLTANYMPEFGRASGGQIRFISKSGSSRYSGNASYLLSETRRCRPTPGRATAARTPTENSGPAPFDQKQYRLLLRRPDPGRDVQGQAVLLRRAGVG